MSQISFSEVSSFRRCAKQWEYRYKRRIKRKLKGVRLLKGEILHEMLNAYIAAKMTKGYKGDDPWDVLDVYAEKYATYFEEERELYGDIIGDCGKIFEGYLRKWRKDPLKYEESEAEVSFNIKGIGINFIGFIDKVAVDPEERRWLMDHKFIKSIPTADDRFQELQLLLYVWAWNQMFPEYPLDGVCWDYARSKAPTEPEVLKSGKSLTIRKNLDCDVHTYMRAIAKNGFNPGDYSEMLTHLQGKEDTFYERVFLPKPSKHMVNEVVEDFIQTAIEVQGKRDPENAAARCARNMSSFNCNNCEFRPVCEAEVRGLDSDYIIQSEYVSRGEAAA